jgi:hypothetical protein
MYVYNKLSRKNKQVDSTDTLKQVPKLTPMSISKNKQVDSTDTLKQVPELTPMSISKNKQVDSTDTLKQVPKLTTMSISKNKEKLYNSYPDNKLSRKNKQVYLTDTLNKIQQLYELTKTTNTTKTELITTELTTELTKTDLTKTDLTKMIIYKCKEKLDNSYHPLHNNKKLLLLIATHTDTVRRYHTILNTLTYFDTTTMDIMIANTKSLKYSNELKHYYKSKNITYYEIENIPSYDFGKWIFLLSNIDYSVYDYVFFINDSFIIEQPVTHFINLAIKSNKELYGYNDSTQEQYHYQSYFFAVRGDAIPKFIHMFNSKKELIQTQRDLIQHFELKMIDYFSSHDCYLKIGNIWFHQGLNIFFTSDFLYEIFKKHGILPFVKLKRLTS